MKVGEREERREMEMAVDLSAGDRGAILTAGRVGGREERDGEGTHLERRVRKRP